MYCKKMYKLKSVSVALFLFWTLQAFDITLQQACSSEGDVRLVSGDGRVDSVNELEGRVEVCIGGQWGTVCDDDWDGRDAAVVCKQLGHPSPLFSTASKFSRFGNGPRLQPILLDEVRCTGSEDRLIDCFHNTTGATDCSHSEDAGVICQPNSCSDGAVRLVGGADGKEGRVEVCFNDTWNSVCSEGWDNSDAAVVCGQLGLMQKGATAAIFGPGLGPIALENVSCNGTEQTLLQCPSDMTEGNSSQCLQHAGAVCEPPCTLDGLTECGLSPGDGGINREEVCFCAADCVVFGDCCRDIRLLANCTEGDPVCNDNDVRLVEGTRAWNGRLEVCIHGQWGSVCDRHFEEVDAEVVCRELGFPTENAFALPGGTFGQIDRIWLAGVECLGIESTILECQSMGAGNFVPCLFGNASGVWCAGAAPPECNESEIRLVNGSSASNGRVEVCHRGVWGTVCSDGWDERDAAVVCRELGQESAHAVPIFELTFGSGTGPIVLDDVACSGQESNLTECNHPGNLVHNCFRIQEASVSCREAPVERCTPTPTPPSVDEAELNRFGVCEPYVGNSPICDRVFAQGVDHVYIPYTRRQGNQGVLLGDLEAALGDLISVASGSCQDLFSSFLCNSIFFGCGSAGRLSPPMSVCAEECRTVQTECPDLWDSLGSSALGGFDFADCSTVGRVLEPLPHCCTDAGIGVSDLPLAAIVGGAVGGGVGLLLLVLLLCVLPAVLYFVHTKLKIRKLKRSLHISYTQQDSITELVRMESLHSRSATITSYHGEECCKDSEVLKMHRALSLRYAPNPSALESIPPLIKAQLFAPRPPSPVTSEYLRKLSTHMLIPSAQIRLLDSIGQGEFGLVYKAHLLKPPQEAMKSNVNPKMVAVKTLKGSFSEETIHQVLDESVKMKTFDHPNVLSLIGVCVDAGPAPYIVMPFMSNGCLLNFLKKERSSLITQEGAEEELLLEAQKRLLNMCIQIATGMEYLAAKKFVHRDLASRNCMIDSQFIIKVSDFGLSEDIYAKNYFRQDKDSSIKLPVKWMAPESLNDGIFTEKSDVWSYGITCWEVFSAGKSPYPGMDPSSIIRMLESGGRLDKPLNTACSDAMYELMNQCWLHNPEERPTFSEVASMVTNILEPIAGYLDLQTITGIVASHHEDNRHAKHKHQSTASLDVPALSHGVTTPVGITIHLDRWSDSSDKALDDKNESSSNPPQLSQKSTTTTTQSNGVPAQVMKEGRENQGRSDGVLAAENHVAVNGLNTTDI